MAEGLIYSPPSPSNPRYHQGGATSPGRNGGFGPDASRTSFNTAAGVSATSRSHRRLDVDGLERDSSYYRDAHEQWARGVNTLLRPGMTASHSAALAKWRAAHGIPEPAPAVVDAATTPERGVGPDRSDASVAAGTPGGRVANAFGLMKTRRLQEQLESLCTSDGSGEVDVDRALGILNSVESMLANGGPPTADRSHSRRGISTSSTATGTVSRGASVGQQTAGEEAAAEEPKTRWRSVALNSVNTQTAAPPPPPPPQPQRSPSTPEPQPSRIEPTNVTTSSTMNGSGIDGGPDPSVPRLTRLPPRPAGGRSQVPVRPPPHHNPNPNYSGLSPEDVEAYKQWWHQYRSWYAQGGDEYDETSARHHHNHEESTRTRHHRRDHQRHASAERSRSDSASRHQHGHRHHHGGFRSASVERLIRRASPGYRPRHGRRDDDTDSRDSFDNSRHHHVPQPQQRRSPPRARSSSPGLEAAAQWARTQHLHDRQVTRSTLATPAPVPTHQRGTPQHQQRPPPASRPPMELSGAVTPPRSANVAASAAAAALSSLNVVSPMTDGESSDDERDGVGQISAIGRQRGAGQLPEVSMVKSTAGALPPYADGDAYDDGSEMDAESQTLPPSSPAAAYSGRSRGGYRDPAEGPTPAFRVQSLTASTAASRSRQAISMQQRSRTAQRVAPMRSPPRQRNPDYSAAGPRGYEPERSGGTAAMNRSRSGKPPGPMRR